MQAAPRGARGACPDAPRGRPFAVTGTPPYALCGWNTRDRPAAMVHALGYSNSLFDPTDPGRLCRGRERWIDSQEREGVPTLHRIVISGASFSDDSARDAFRGISYSRLDSGGILTRLFAGKVVVACAEDAHPRVVPDSAKGVEHYELRNPGGPLARWAVRWTAVCRDGDAINEAIQAGADVLLVLDAEPEPDDAPSPVVQAPLADAHLDPPHTGGLPESLRELVFLLTGYRMGGSPVRSFQPVALPALTDVCEAVVLVHRDKHGHCLGIYTGDARADLDGPLVDLAAGVEALAVPFAIPPMLARWDRALWELRQDWDDTTQGEYPVPPASDPSYGWSRRDLGRHPAGEGEE